MALRTRHAGQGPPGALAGSRAPQTSQVWDPLLITLVTWLLSVLLHFGTDVTRNLKVATSRQEQRFGSADINHTPPKAYDSGLGTMVSLNPRVRQAICLQQKKKYWG